MQAHDHFRELSALAAIGQLSTDEYGELSEHLAICASCHRASEEYDFILDQLPLPEPSAALAALQQLHSASYRQRFFQRASAEGLHFTRQALGPKKKPAFAIHFAQWRPFALGAATAAAILVVALVLYPLGRTAPMQVAIPSPVAPRVPAVSAAETKSPDVDRLEERRRAADARLNNLRAALQQAQLQKDRLGDELEKWKAQAGRLQAENEQTAQQLSNAKADTDKAGKENSLLVASLVAQQDKIKDLSEQVQLQTAAVERERQLTAVAHDVREMMGARNLHMVDVADLDGRGKSKKSFGRVFYAEGRSLIFYAFDLSQKGSAGKVSFQAWGQMTGGSSSVKNLGVFHIDDHAQKRWVLRVDDPQLLSSIESVFVTVEPAPGRDRPTGERLLNAYLGTPANHP